jgi:plasmid maintenance system antidote protein VapI
MLEELVETTGVRERELAKQIGVLQEEIQTI